MNSWINCKLQTINKMRVFRVNICPPVLIWLWLLRTIEHTVSAMFSIDNCKSNFKSTNWRFYKSMRRISEKCTFWRKYSQFHRLVSSANFTQPLAGRKLLLLFRPSIAALGINLSTGEGVISLFPTNFPKVYGPDNWQRYKAIAS